MRVIRKCFGWIVKKLEKTLIQVSIGVTMIVILHFTIIMSVEAGNIAKELYETKTITITNVARGADDRITLDDRQTEQGAGSIDEVDETIEEKIKRVFGEEGDRAVEVARCESSLNPESIGDTQLSKPSYGLFQISKIYHDYPEEQLLDEDENIRIAKKIFDGGGWKRWTCARNLGFNK